MSLRRVALVSLLVIIPIFAGAQAVSDTQKMAQDLLSRVKALQQQSAATSSCPKITTSLKRGSSGTNVKSLQQFLAKDPGVYPEGQVSSTYGPATEAAVKRWQIKYNVVSSGDAATTGLGSVGPKTITAIAQQCAGSSAMTAATAPNAGGMITVSPISGGVPLSVVVQAVANTSHVCGGGLYTINYGDGAIQSQISVPANMCGPVAQAFSHVYRKTGTYSVTLSSGAHQTSIVVTVR